ncbi:MAG TPA: VWA domain-containing protein [Bacteroidales bacterium]|nr:VWA domain-containing protein [Bacteroidales bacterium]
MELVKFENPQYFYLFALLPVIIGLFVLTWYFRIRALRKFGRSETLPLLMPYRSVRRPWFRFGLVVLAISSLFLAMANPQVGSRMEEAKREGVDIMIVFDVSRSMLAEDIRPNRLERSRLAVLRLIDQLGQDRIGMVVFAGTAITQVPITSDHTAAKMLLRTVGVHTVSVQGTDISAAIERAKMAFREEDLENNAIIIVSDGENHLNDPVETAKLAAERGIVIHTVGIGTREGAPIPVFENGQRQGFFRDRQGRTVITRYNEAVMKSIAETTGGVFRHGTGADLGLGEILNEIRQMEQETFEAVVFTDYQSRFTIFVAMALAFLFLEIMVFERKNKWLHKIKLFKPL